MIESRRNGFTLIELIVAVGVVSVIVAAMVGIMLDGMKSSTKTKAIERIEEQGSIVLREIRKNIMSADAESLVCPSVPSDSITFTSRTDGRETTLLCTDDSIASSSAALGQTITLTSSDVGISGGCSNFISSCSTTGSAPVVSVQFGLYMVGGNERSTSASRRFESTMVVRN